MTESAVTSRLATMRNDQHGFEFQEQIGQSSMTEVWRAYQPALQRTVTLKILRGEFASDPEEVERFHREAQTTCSLVHDNILQIYDAVREGDTHFLVMEHVSGPTLSALLMNEALAPARALDMAGQIAEGLRFAWEKAQLIHRNVTPRAIMLDGPESAKLGYVGQSLRVDPLHPDQRLLSGMIVGTPYYMAPEQARGSAHLDARTDMYGLGATLYHMITGLIPFADLSPEDALRSQITEPLALPSDFERQLPDAFAEIMNRLLMKSQSDRYADWGEVCMRIQEARSQQAPPSRAKKRSAPRRKRIIVKRRSDSTPWSRSS